MKDIKTMTHDACLAEIDALRAEDDRLRLYRDTLTDQNLHLHKNVEKARDAARRVGIFDADPEAKAAADADLKLCMDLVDDNVHDTRALDDRRREIGRRLDRLISRKVDTTPIDPSVVVEPFNWRPVEDFDVTGIPGMTSSGFDGTIQSRCEEAL